MKKFLRFLLAALAIIVIGIIVLGIVEPQDVTVQRTVIINAPKDATFDKIVHFKEWIHWSPWYLMDTAEKMTYYGTDGTKGSGYHWVGDDKKTGEGDMVNSGVDGTKLSYDLHFIKPFDGKAAGYLAATDTANGQTKVTWSFSAHHGFPSNAMFAFMNMDKMLGGDFERGLQNLKKYVESNPAQGSSVSIIEMDMPAMMFAGVRKKIGWNDMSKFYMETYGMLGKTLKPGPGTRAFSIFYNWDTTHHSADVAAVFTVTDTTAHNKGISYFSLPASKALMSVYKGGYSKMGKVHGALMNQVMAKKLNMGTVLEEYVVGPGTEKDSTKWVTNVIYTVK